MHNSMTAHSASHSDCVGMCVLIMPCHLPSLLRQKAWKRAAGTSILSPENGSTCVIPSAGGAEAAPFLLVLARPSCPE